MIRETGRITCDVLGFNSMALKLKKRHTAPCRERNGIREWDHSFLRCKCPYFAEGTLSLDGYTRLSTKEHNLDRAERVKRAWEERGTTEAPSAPEPLVDPTDTHTTLETASVEFE